MADPKHPVSPKEPANPEQMQVRDVDTKELVIITLTHAQDLLNFHKVLVREQQKEVEAFKKLRIELEVCLRSGSFSYTELRSKILETPS